MKLPILLLTAALVLPASGWSRDDSHRWEGRDLGNRIEESSHKTGNMFERGLMSIHNTLQPLGNTFKKGSRSTESTIRKTDDRIEKTRDGMFDREHDGLFR